jgi:hypothetical protein
MQTLENAPEKFIRKLTAPGAMTAVSAVVLAVTVLPLAGGLPKPYEVREFRAGVTALMNGETSTPSLEPAFYPHSGRGAPVVRTEARAPARVQHTSLQAEDTADLAMLNIDGADALTDLETAEVAETFEEPVVTCDGDCDAVKKEPDPFAEEGYGVVEDNAF